MLGLTSYSIRETVTVSTSFSELVGYLIRAGGPVTASYTPCPLPTPPRPLSTCTYRAST